MARAAGGRRDTQAAHVHHQVSETYHGPLTSPYQGARERYHKLLDANFTGLPTVMPEMLAFDVGADQRPSAQAAGGAASWVSAVERKAPATRPAQARRCPADRAHSGPRIRWAGRALQAERARTRTWAQRAGRPGVPARTRTAARAQMTARAQTAARARTTARTGTTALGQAQAQTPAARPEPGPGCPSRQDARPGLPPKPRGRLVAASAAPTRPGPTAAVAASTPAAGPGPASPRR
jgi:hypothetical protein